MTKNAVIFIIIYILTSCTVKKVYTPVTVISNSIISKNLKLSKGYNKNWEFKDILLDTVSGISLQRAYDDILTNKANKKVIVALIDMTVEINHIGLKKHIWENKNEIPNNNIDDDNNGYIDDINGWNFLGNQKKENNEFVNYEYTRILKKYNHIFKNKMLEEISFKDSLNYIIYKKAEKKYNEKLVFAQKDIDYIKMVQKGKKQSEELIAKYLNNEYNMSDLDSLKKIYSNDEELQRMIKRKSNFIINGFSDNYISIYKLKAQERIDKLLNLEYNDRTIQKDNVNDLNDIKYGSNIFNSNSELLDHGTKMAGNIIKVGQKNEIKIMPLTVSAYGDEHDKDIALAIRYAVNNGAKIINMSFAKEFSLHQKWVLEAIKYAENQNVLIVSAASNENENLDDHNTNWFPNDHDYFNYNEITDNFLNVGSSGMYVDENLKSSFSNYGKNEVDIFAPGENIYTTYPNNKFNNSYGGTSSAAAITSGVAALVFSYYPKLTASQVKHILMDSGLEYTFDVNTPTNEDKNKKTPFNKLSKSGKVLNAYNALILAEKE